MNNGNNAANTRICPACGQVIDENGYFVVCPECGAAHHKDCWFTLGGCSAKGFEHKLVPVAKPFSQNVNAAPAAAFEEMRVPTAEPKVEKKVEKKKKNKSGVITVIIAAVMLIAIVGLGLMSAFLNDGNSWSTPSGRKVSSDNNVIAITDSVETLQSKYDTAVRNLHDGYGAEAYVIFTDVALSGGYSNVDDTLGVLDIIRALEDGRLRDGQRYSLKSYIDSIYSLSDTQAIQMIVNSSEIIKGVIKLEGRWKYNDGNAYNDDYAYGVYKHMSTKFSVADGVLSEDADNGFVYTANIAVRYEDGEYVYYVADPCSGVLVTVEDVSVTYGGRDSFWLRRYDETGSTLLWDMQLITSND